MNSAEFRKELVKIMPGYSWTVHKSSNPTCYQSATGIQSSGFNRLCTLMVIRTEKNDFVWYEAKSAGSGTKSPWDHTTGGVTLARALRELQNLYKWTANYSASLAARMEAGRKASVAAEPEKQ